MIVTCVSCLTKFNLDDSKIPSKGTKVRCSRCQHVFYIAPPLGQKEEPEENFESITKYHKELFKPEEKEEAEESFESFAKQHKELFKPEKKEEAEEDIKPFAKNHKELFKPEKEEEEFPEFTAPLEFAKEPMAAEEEEEAFPFSEKAPTEKGLDMVPPVEGEPETKTFKSKRMVRRERKRPSLFFVFVVVLILLALGALYYLWTGLGSVGKLASYFENPMGKITHLWNQIGGTEKRGLTIGDLAGYEEKVGEFPLFIIEGKVNNQSRYTKKYIKVKIAIFDQNKVKVAEKETVCGRIIGRGELKNFPSEIFLEEIVIKPKTEEETIAAPGKTIPFMLIFKNLSSQAKEFTVEIVEAPNL